MNNEAFSKINQTKSLFKRIIAPLKRKLDLSFGYMIVFSDGKYYTIAENTDCIYDFVTYVNKSRIFCDRNVTNHFDGEYSFTLWPETPTCKAMEIYHKYNIWNGLTVSKKNENYIELYWFNGGITRSDWRKYFIRNKALLLEFIHYFSAYKKFLFIPEKDSDRDLFKFTQGFDNSIINSEYIQNEAHDIKKFLNILHSNIISVETFQLETDLSPREVEVLSNICHGFTAKIIANKLDISIKTVQQYIERIKHKTGFHFKTDLINFYENYFHKKS